MENDFKKKNFIEKLWLKFRDKNQYKIYKWEYNNYIQEKVASHFLSQNRVNTLNKINIICQTNNNTINVSHSGNIGDIIYSLATIKRIYEYTGASINFYLKPGKPLILSGYLSHPMGKTMLNHQTALMLQPLIKSQPYIASCEIYDKQIIHIDLDYFRSGVIPLNRTNIARWYGYFTGVNPELWKNWITVIPDKKYADKIIIARSDRYKNSFIDYSFLNRYKNLYFLGLPQEYNNMKIVLPDLNLIKVASFLEMANIIAGAKFFIGNQSFPYALAEALKVPRVLESYYHMLNVVPEGEFSYDFFFQEHFESIVKQLNS